jgi:3-oxoacyl-[acyl-carrier protein] reductase
MSSDLTGKVALVTGASGGIGTALVEALVERGATVVATSRNHQNPTTPGRVHHRQLDVADLESLQPFVAQVIDEFGSLDLVLPNAGIAPVHTLPEIDLTTWQETLTVNLTAPFLLAQAALPDMVNRGYGRILFTSSAAAFVGGFVGPHYAASKAALHGLVASLASNYAPYGVTVNAIAPALISDAKMIDENQDRIAAARIPVGRLGRPQEVADLAAAMLTNGYLTGHVTLLDGGIHPR